MPDVTRRSPWLRSLLVILATAIPLVPILIAISLSDGPSAPPAGTTAVPLALTPLAGQPSPRKTGFVPPGSGALIASMRFAVNLHQSAGSRRVYGHLPLRTPFGSPQSLLVVRVSGHWLGVLSPVAGNGHVGWIPAGAASLTREHWRLAVSLSRRRLTVIDGRRVVARWRIAIGAPASPTPTGRFAVTDRLRTGDPAGPYGCCILALSAVAPHAIQGWSGGNRVAIHSTPDTSSIGLPVSHGCMRLTLAQGAWLLRHVPLGTPTDIRA